MRPATAVILSGGNNLRMQANKAFLKVADQPLIEGLVKKLRPVFAEIVVVTNEPNQYDFLDVRVVTDIIPRHGPLSGIHAGLMTSAYRNCFVVACDMPFVEPRLAGYLADLMTDDDDVVVPLVNDHFQPLSAVYAKTCVPHIEQSLREGEHQVIAFYPQVRVRSVGETELAAYARIDRVFINVNTPRELDLARELAGEGGHRDATGQG